MIASPNRLKMDFGAQGEAFTSTATSKPCAFDAGSNSGDSVQCHDIVSIHVSLFRTISVNCEPLVHKGSCGTKARASVPPKAAPILVIGVFVRDGHDHTFQFQGELDLAT